MAALALQRQFLSVQWNSGRAWRPYPRCSTPMVSLSTARVTDCVQIFMGYGARPNSQLLQVWPRACVRVPALPHEPCHHHIVTFPPSVLMLPLVPVCVRHTCPCLDHHSTAAMCWRATPVTA